MGIPVAKKRFSASSLLVCLTLAGALGAGFGAGAFARAAGGKDPGDGQAATPASIDLVRSIVPPEAYDAMLELMYEQMSASMQQAGGGAGIPPDKQKALKAAVKECLPYEDLLNWTAGIYSKHFSKKEVDDVATFYRTGTGKKLARLMPVLTGEVGAKVAPLLMTRLPEALKKHGLQ